MQGEVNEVSARSGSRAAQQEYMAWSRVEPVTTVAQLAGVDAFLLIAMIVERAKKVRRNKHECGELASDVDAIQGVLRQVQLKQHPEIDDLVEKLEAALREACVLVATCEATGYLRRFFRSGKLAEQFQRIRQRIQLYVDLFPIISHVDTTRRLIRIIQRLEEPQAPQVSSSLEMIDSQHYYYLIHFIN